MWQTEQVSNDEAVALRKNHVVATLASIRVASRLSRSPEFASDERFVLTAMHVNVIDRAMFASRNTGNRPVATNRGPRSMIGKVLAHHYVVTNGQIIEAVVARASDKRVERKIRIPFAIPRFGINDIQVCDIPTEGTF